MVDAAPDPPDAGESPSGLPGADTGGAIGVTSASRATLGAADELRNGGRRIRAPTIADDEPDGEPNAAPPPLPLLPTALSGPSPRDADTPLVSRQPELSDAL